jgi:hypothetical protein
MMVIEFHGVCDDLLEKSSTKTVLASTIEHLSGAFVSVHARPNNSRPSRRFGNDLVVPEVLEVTFLRDDFYREHLVHGSYRPLLPHPQDIQRDWLAAPPAFFGGRWRLYAPVFARFGKSFPIRRATTFTKLASRSPLSGTVFIGG